MEFETDNGATANDKFHSDALIPYSFNETKFNCADDQMPQQIHKVSWNWFELSENFQFDSIFYLFNFVDFIRFQFRTMTNKMIW